MKTVVIRRGINGFRYSVYAELGAFLFNADSMKQIRQWYGYELSHDLVMIRKDLNGKR